MRFWDSSAVVPLVVHQRAAARADRWFGDDPSVVLWSLTPVEITSALWRLAREGVLSEDDARGAEARADELVAASHTVADIGSVQALARRLLRIHALRAADALQLAAALVWVSGRPEGQTLHTLDARLALAARREGFDVP